MSTKIEQSEGVSVKGRENVEIEWVGSPYHKKGDKSIVHKVQAEKLVNKGFAKYSK